MRERLLIVTGYATDFTKTASEDYVLPVDAVPHKLMISVHYYTPWQFVGMTEDASWGKMQPTWGSASDVADLKRLFDLMQGFTQQHDIPAFIGEFGVTDKKEAASRVRWMTAVAQASFKRKMVPVLWDTGGDIARYPPYAASPALQLTLQTLRGDGGTGNVIKELGVVLGWRLGPQAIVEHCRSLDPGGAAARDKLLADWRSLNDDLIGAVDGTVAEVVPLLDRKTPPETLIATLQGQVGKLLVETTFEGKSRRGGARDLQDGNGRFAASMENRRCAEIAAVADPAARLEGGTQPEVRRGEGEMRAVRVHSRT
jgi:hypothetical protein